MQQAAFSQNLIVTQLVNEFLPFYALRRFAIQNTASHAGGVLPMGSGKHRKLKKYDPSAYLSTTP
jgi:hypothetical protein